MSAQTRLFTASGTVLALSLAAAGVAPAAQGATFVRSLRAVVVPAVPRPPTKALPAALDVKTPYEGQVSCDPRPKPGLTAFAALMKARYKAGAVGTYRPCQGDVSEHYESRAMDWMLSASNPGQKAIATSVITWLSANGGVVARRFGISYIVFNKKVWKEYRTPTGWTTYTGADPHTSHVHISFSWDGAMKRTSWWTGTATKVVDRGPCRVYAGQFAPLNTRTIRTTACPTKLAAAPVSRYQVAVYGQKSAQIALAQKALRLPADGAFGMGTFNALVVWQRGRVPITGVLDKATWVRMGRR